MYQRNHKTTNLMCDVSDLHHIVKLGIRFPTILIDPPWQYTNKASNGAAQNHYPTMSVQEIMSLPVGELAAKQAHLHLWTTSSFLFECERLMQAWGFTYKSSLVWIKRRLGLGNYWRLAHEFLLLGTRGKAPFLKKSQWSWVLADGSLHSQKPAQVRSMIELVSPPPRLELFARELAPGWVVWGNEIERQSLLSTVQEL